MKTLYRALLLALAVAFAVPAAAQTHLSSDPRVQVARMLVANQKFDAALKVLRILRRDNPDNTDILFLSALAAIGEARKREDEGERDKLLDEAVAALRTILIDRPELTRVRLELARAFYLKGEDTLARRHFEQTLAGGLSSVVAANVQRFLREIRARRRWQGRFGLALAPDSNLNAVSSTRTIWLDTPFGRLPFTLDEETERKSGIGVSIWGGGEYQHPLSARWRLRSGADASVREYKGGDFDRQFASAYLGPRWLIDARTDASLLATVQREWSAGRPTTDQFGMRLEGRHRLTPRLSVQGRVGARRRNCRDCDWLDGPLGEVSLGANWVALPILRVGGNAGWNWARANSEHWRSDGPRIGLGATLALPLGFTVGVHVSRQRTEYQGSGLLHRTIDRKPREDETQTLSLSVHNRALTVYGFSPRLSLVNEQRDTNAQVLDYDRNRFPSPRLLLSSPPPLAGEAGWGLSRRDGRLPGASPAASAGGSGPSPCPLPAGEGLPGARLPPLPACGEAAMKSPLPACGERPGEGPAAVQPGEAQAG